MMHALSYGIRGSLKPVVTHRGLLSGQHIHKSLAEKAEMIGVLDMAIQ
jgi:hypothetical protein